MRPTHHDGFDVLVAEYFVFGEIRPVGADPPTLNELRAHAPAHLAGYKLPRDLIVVDQVQRTPTGKADLLWARELLR
jgi:acyl-CoA synthetase (AMP-forming)/AMP-acid ligase II